MDFDCFASFLFFFLCEFVISEHVCNILLFNLNVLHSFFLYCNSLDLHLVFFFFFIFYMLLNLTFFVQPC